MTEIWGIRAADTVFCRQKGVYASDGESGMLEKGWREWGQGSRRTSSLVVEDTTEVVAIREDVGLMGEVGAAGVDEVDAWET